MKDKQIPTVEEQTQEMYNKAVGWFTSKVRPRIVAALAVPKAVVKLDGVAVSLKDRLVTFKVSIAVGALGCYAIVKVSLKTWRVRRVIWKANDEVVNALNGAFAIAAEAAKATKETS